MEKLRLLRNKGILIMILKEISQTVKIILTVKQFFNTEDLVICYNLV